MALDPSRLEWRSELGHGEHNLAVLREQRGELDGARAGFLGELATLDRLLLQNPADLETLNRIADAHSWLGNIAEQQGEFAEALKQFSAQASQLEQLVSKEPGTARWREELVNGALLFQADVYLATGQPAAAGERLREARRLIDELVAHDSSNRLWLAVSLGTGLKEAILVRLQGDTAAAAGMLERVRPQLESLSAAEPTDRRFAHWLATAWRVEAQVREPSDIAAAAAAAARATELGEKAIREGRATDTDVGECATAFEVAGEIASQTGAGAAARNDWTRAAEMLAPRLNGTRDWRLLDPAARVAAKLGRSEDARATISKLTQLGYVPLDPWPDMDGSAAGRILNPKPRPQ